MSKLLESQPCDYSGISTNESDAEVCHGSDGKFRLHPDGYTICLCDLHWEQLTKIFLHASEDLEEES